MIKPELRSAEPVNPGHALLTLKGWKGSQNGVTVSVMRNQDSHYLDVNGKWSSGEVYLQLPVLTLVDNLPALQVGPSFVDPLLANRQVAYRLTAKDEAMQDMGILMIAGDLLSSQAAGKSPNTDGPQRLPDVALAEPVTVAEPVPEPAIVAESEPAAKPRPSGGVKRALIAGVILLLVILLAVAAWWFFLRAPGPAKAPASSAIASGPCGTDAMSSANDLDFVKSCLRSQPGSVQLLSVIDKAKADKRCDIAQRLYAYKAQSGDTQIALRYAHEYDPESASQSGCFSADAQTAIYWYENVVSQDSQNSEAKGRLAALKK